jgi:hypothetical protein
MHRWLSINERSTMSYFILESTKRLLKTLQYILITWLAKFKSSQTHRLAIWKLTHPHRNHVFSRQWRSGLTNKSRPETARSGAEGRGHGNGDSCILEPCIAQRSHMVAEKQNIFFEASDATPCTYIYLPDLSCEPPRANFHYVVLPPSRWIKPTCISKLLIWLT